MPARLPDHAGRVIHVRHAGPARVMHGGAQDDPGAGDGHEALARSTAAGKIGAISDAARCAAGR